MSSDSQGRMVDVNRLRLEDIPAEVLERLRVQDAKRAAPSDQVRRLQARWGTTRHDGRRLRNRKKRVPNRLREEDRALIPVALKHWRAVHALNQEDAAARIGYSPASRMWGLYERGASAPPYRTLLLIIAATGMGRWEDEFQGLPPDLRLEAMRNRHRRSVLERRRGREQRRKQ